MARRVFTSLIIAAFLLSSYTAFSAQPPAPIKVACIGDSITFGAGIQDRGNNSYPAQFGRMLGEKWSVNNFGVNAATLLKKGNRPYWRLKQYRAALDFKPDVVVIKLGTNDSKPGNWRHKADYVPNYIELIKSFQQLESKPTVWICYPVPAYPGAWGITDKVMKEEIRPRIDEVAKKAGVKIIDLYTALSNKKEFFPDTVHPNAAGAKLMAETIAAAISAAGPGTGSHAVAPATIKDIKAYCIDFNWGPGGPNRFARPGLWADADPVEHVAWYKAMGVNVIQTFCISCNGYAWYKNGTVPEQPGLKHDFLPEMVRLGHQEGMLVMGYFCIGANTKWGQEHPDLSYGYSSAVHIPYTDEYLTYLSTALGDAVRKTGIDGVMIDWVWQPQRKSTKGTWLECAKKLYEHLMSEVFPGEGTLSKGQEVAYGRKAIDRCWKTIHKAAQEADPKCIVWLASNNSTHPHVVNSAMYKEADWLMNEGGDLKRINAVKPMIGKHTRLITCLANWNRQNATTVVPAALREGVGLYGFAKPRADSLLPLEQLLARPVRQLRGDDRNIAVLARAYHGVSIDAVRNDKGEFVEPVKQR